MASGCYAFGSELFVAMVVEVAIPSYEGLYGQGSISSFRDLEVTKHLDQPGFLLQS